jgi:hypothetical protein
MDFETILKNRRSIRDFQSREVPLSIITEIIQDTCLAPTSSNGQPCRFIIIRDRGILDELGVPEDCRIVAPIVMGYPVLVPPSSERHPPEILKVIPGAASDL